MNELASEQLLVCLQLENDPSASLWYEEIQETIKLANAHAVEGNHRE